MVNGPIAREAYYFFKKILIFYWLLCLFLSIPFLEVEIRRIMAPLPYLLADKRRGAQISAGSFWKRAKVS